MQRRVSRTCDVVLLSIALTACSAAPDGCPPGQRRMVNEVLYFGSGKADGVVSADDWQRFVDEEIVTRFPAGFTTSTASGYWQPEGGTILREMAFVLNVVRADRADLDRAIGALIEVYKQRFAQHSVLRVHAPVCAAM